MQFPSPTEILLRQGPIEYEDPAGNGFYKIQKTTGSGDYIGNGTFYEMLPDGSKKEHQRYFDNNVMSGRTIEEKEQLFHNILTKTLTLNFDMFRKIHQSGNQEAIQRAQDNFGATVTNPFWKYNK
jgi:hypothetical protein